MNDPGPRAFSDRMESSDREESAQNQYVGACSQSEKSINFSGTCSSTDIAIDIAVESPLWDAFDEADALAERAIETALQHARVELFPGAEVSLLLSDDAFIRSLNARWRGQDKPTNVLSFPAAANPAATPVLGDIAIAFETMAREADEEGKSLRAHFTHLVVHGLLHLIGHDHESEAEAEAMESLEREILAALGIDDPYRLAFVDSNG